VGGERSSFVLSGVRAGRGVPPLCGIQDVYVIISTVNDFDNHAVI